MADNTKTKLKDLRRQKRAIEKEIKLHTGKTRMDAYMAEWQALSNLKQKFIKELRNHPTFGNMSWKRFADTKDYFIYALNKGQYTHKSVNKTDPWITDALKAGKTEAELIENATRMRKAQWQRNETARNRKRKANKEANKDKTNPIAEQLNKTQRSAMRDRGVG